MIWHATIWALWKARNDFEVVGIVEEVKVHSWRWVLSSKHNPSCLFFEWCWNPQLCLARKFTRPLLWGALDLRFCFYLGCSLLLLTGYSLGVCLVLCLQLLLSVLPALFRFVFLLCGALFQALWFLQVLVAVVFSSGGLGVRQGYACGSLHVYVGLYILI